ncbi:OmpA family protein [Neolewinella aurantiaca]|uniref:OmpA family protein n=1 Tax=Neolewinella aurantiaca TaxID=2602767 RepID=A0A5C7FQY6_9BACT|nr:OmpA family protein [Neolewinella aurantiaca]TXF87805.1 OmpA family protein [Neolewinella aurantiaca]
MKRLIIPALLTAIGMSACVPKNQYEALETERNYYRNQTALADSLNDQRAISSYDEVDVTGVELNQRIRQVEALTATNVALNQSYQSLQARYEELLGQSQELLSTSGDQVSSLQQSLAERTTAVSQREDELRQMEVDLAAREAAIARVEADFQTAGDAPGTYGSSASAPLAYGSSVTPQNLSASQNTALRINEIQSELSQVLASYPVSSQKMEVEGSDKLRVTLSESLLSSDGFSINPAGQSLLRSIAGVLRNYASAEILVIGHADNTGGNALRAYEDSSDKAINAATQLINFGISPRKLTVAGKGFYDPVTNGITQVDLEKNRRTELVISVYEY